MSWHGKEERERSGEQGSYGKGTGEPIHLHRRRGWLFHAGHDRLHPKYPAPFALRFYRRLMRDGYSGTRFLERINGDLLTFLRRGADRRNASLCATQQGSLKSYGQQDVRTAHTDFRSSTAIGAKRLRYCQHLGLGSRCSGAVLSRNGTHARSFSHEQSLCHPWQKLVHCCG